MTMKFLVQEIVEFIDDVRELINAAQENAVDECERKRFEKTGNKMLDLIGDYADALEKIL